MNDRYKKAINKIENDKKCKPIGGCLIMSYGATGPTGPTGPSGVITPGTFLFNVEGPTGEANIVVGDELIFQSSTLDITVSQGSAIVDIEYNGGGSVGPTGPAGPSGDSAYQIALNNGFIGTEQQWLASLVGPTGPVGPAGGTFLQYNEEYMYVEVAQPTIDGITEFSTTYVMPFSGVAKQVNVTVEVGYVNIGPGTLGTLSYILAKRPYGTTTETIIATGELSPKLDENSPYDETLTLLDIINVPFDQNDELILKLSYDIDQVGSSSFYCSANATIYVEGN